MRIYALFVCSLLITFSARSQETFWQQTGGPLSQQDVRSLTSNSRGDVFAGTWTAGEVYRSTDNGGTWTVCGPIPNTNPILHMAVDQHDHIFASVWGRGMARSTDNGATWQMKTTGFNSTTPRLVLVDKQNNIWVATEQGLFRSSDDGESWTNTKPGVFGGAFLDSTGAIVTGDSYTLFRSTDGGTSWTSTPISTCYCGTINSDGSYFGWHPPSLLYRSTDYGVNWTSLNSPVSWNPLTAMLSCTPQGELYYAANADNGGILRSSDHGESWQVTNSGLTNLRVTCIYPHPNGYLYIGTGFAGVFRTTQPVKPMDISVSLPEAVAAPGSMLEFPVNATNVSGWGILSYEFTLTYNSPDSILSFDAVPITTGTLSARNGWSVQVNTTAPNQITVGAYGATPLSGQGALVKLSLHAFPTSATGDSSRITITHFVFNSGNPVPAIQNGSVTVHERVCGDADENGLVQAYDAALALREAVGPMSPPPAPLTAMGRLNADVNMNGKVEAYDAALILRHAIGLPMPESTATCFGSGQLVALHAKLALSAKLLAVQRSTDQTAVRLNIVGVPKGMQAFSYSFELNLPAANDDTVAVTLPQLAQGYLATVNHLGNGHFMVGIINPYGVDVESIPITITARNASSLNEINLSQLFLNDAANAAITLTNVTTAIEPPTVKAVQPVSYDLAGAYPNPFNPSTRIVFQLPVSDRVDLAVYNALGVRIKTLIHEPMEAGIHEVSWNGTNDLEQTVATGQYFCMMHAGPFVKTIHLIFLK